MITKNLFSKTLKRYSNLFLLVSNDLQRLLSIKLCVRQIVHMLMPVC